MKRILFIIGISTFFWQAACHHRNSIENKSRFTLPQEYYKGAENTPRTDPKEEFTYLPEVTVYFDFNKTYLSTESKAKLTEFYNKILKSQSEAVYFVEGNTDSVGSEDYNLVLSEKRAQTVIAFLVHLGAYPQQFSLLARGELNPIADDELYPQLNRRVILYKKTKN